jgi:hypothetical protein
MSWEQIMQKSEKVRKAKHMIKVCKKKKKTPETAWRDPIGQIWDNF